MAFCLCGSCSPGRLFLGAAVWSFRRRLCGACSPFWLRGVGVLVRAALAALVLLFGFALGFGLALVVVFWGGVAASPSFLLVLLVLFVGSFFFSVVLPL